jgi:hypothetical protein
LDELVRLPQLIFGGVAVPNWHEGAFESLAIITVWVFVFVATRRILKRFYYLEDQLQMCGWCRKLKGQGDWVSLEDYLTKNSASKPPSASVRTAAAASSRTTSVPLFDFRV